MKRGGGKEREAPTKNRHNRMVCSQEAEVTKKPGAHNTSVRYVTKVPRTLPPAN